MGNVVKLRARATCSQICFTEANKCDNLEPCKSVKKAGGTVDGEVGS